MKKIYYAVLAGLLVSCLNVFAQDDKDDTHDVQITIPEVALLDIESGGSKNIILAFVAPTEAGNPLTAPTANTSLWLNYSSIVATTGSDASRTVTVQITTGTLPSGTSLTVQAAAPTGANGGGTLAAAGSAVTLSASSQTLLSGIGSGYTGNGANNGHQLTYNLEVASGNYANLKYDNSSTVTVTYTISDN